MAVVLQVAVPVLDVGETALIGMITVDEQQVDLADFRIGRVLRVAHDDVNVGIGAMLVQHVPEKFIVLRFDVDGMNGDARAGGGSHHEQAAAVEAANFQDAEARAPRNGEDIFHFPRAKPDELLGQLRARGQDEAPEVGLPHATCLEAGVFLRQDILGSGGGAEQFKKSWIFQAATPARCGWRHSGNSRGLSTAAVACPLTVPIRSAVPCAPAGR